MLENRNLCAYTILQKELLKVSDRMVHRTSITSQISFSDIQASRKVLLSLSILAVLFKYRDKKE